MFANEKVTSWGQCSSGKCPVRFVKDLLVVERVPFESLISSLGAERKNPFE